MPTNIARLIRPSSYVLNAARLAKHDDPSHPQRVVYLSVISSSLRCLYLF